MEEGKPSGTANRKLWYGLTLLLAFLLGAYSANSRRGISIAGLGELNFEKFSRVYLTVIASYVDEPDLDELEVGAIEGMLSSLDPHSIYIPPREQTRIAERFDGEFGGIGIQFDVVDEGVMVVSPIPGTPADRMGLRAGDVFIEIDGVSTFGITTEEVFEKLRGPEGSQVELKVHRGGEDPFAVTLTRGRIPIHSVEAAFLLADNRTGYILINQFTSVTATELEEALNLLDSQGMERLILDLRGNSGGYLGQADEVVDRFISGGLVIVTTHGRARGTTEERLATDDATHPYMPLVVLVNAGSASASEIVAGAIQDHDRGLIVGQPTFGKGLVQQPIQLEDGAVVRLTTSRWYTPSGRCVQRSYQHGLGEYYTTAGGLSEEGAVDTAGLDTARVYYTRTGRNVYGWRGIIPDKTVDPGRLSGYGTRLMRERVLIDWSRQYAERVGDIGLSFEQYRSDWSIPREDVEAFIQYAAEQGIPFDRAGWTEDRAYLLVQMKAEMAQRFFNGREFLWRMLVTMDAQIDSAQASFEEADRLARRPSERARG